MPSPDVTIVASRLPIVGGGDERRCGRKICAQHSRSGVHMKAVESFRYVALTAGALCSVKAISISTALTFGIFQLLGELGSAETQRAVAYRILIGYGIFTISTACVSLVNSFIELKRRHRPNALFWLSSLAIGAYFAQLGYAFLPIPMVMRNPVLSQFTEGLASLALFGIIGMATPLFVGRFR